MDKLTRELFVTLLLAAASTPALAQAAAEVTDLDAPAFLVRGGSTRALDARAEIFRGYSARVATAEVADVTWHRVSLLGFGSAEEARAAAARLEADYDVATSWVQRR